jgi:hypothetical protein
MDTQTHMRTQQALSDDCQPTTDAPVVQIRDETCVALLLSAIAIHALARARALPAVEISLRTHR